MNSRNFTVAGLRVLSLSLVLPGFVLALAAQTNTPPLASQKQPQKSNMELVGYNDLQARAAYQPTIHKQGNRWIAYVGHHAGSQLNPLTGQQEINGTSILDVTDPKQPRYLFHIPGEPPKGAGGDSGGAQMVRACDGSELPHGDKSKTYLLRSYGNSAHEIWDVTNPAKPNRLTVVVSGLSDTHKSWWECDTGIAFLVSGLPDWRGRRMMQVYDLSDPSKPVFIRNFGLPGQQPGATGTVTGDLHGPISTGPKGNRVYMAFGPGGNGTLQILDREKLLKGPKDPTNENLIYPQVARFDFPAEVGAHSAFPLIGMDLIDLDKQKDPKRHDFVVVPGETFPNECQEPMRQMVHIFDVTQESRPVGVSTFTVPESSEKFCSRGGRFGTHSTNENMTPIYYKRVVFVSHFNAGVRAIDVRDPFHPKEIGYFIPAITEKTDKRCVGEGASQSCKIAIQTNNVEVDDRGYIYIVDRANTGMHILQLTGAARQTADFSQSSASRP